MSLIKLREVLPLFSMAVRRSLDELEARVQAVIKEKCTSIHPSVEWRFRRAVLDSIEDHEGEEATELEPIVFRDIYPLYAATDIRGSSVQRSLAVQADLGVHLRLALDVVEAARAVRPLPVLDEMSYRIERHARQIEQVMSSGDEVTVLASCASTSSRCSSRWSTSGRGSGTSSARTVLLSRPILAPSTSGAGSTKRA